MKLTLNRYPTGLTCTIGELMIDGQFLCHTLEDPIREIADRPVKDWKVAGDTAIPSGLYSVEISWSNRFQEDLPHIYEVPGFTGIRMHAGNTSADTEGCVLVGVWNGGEFIHASRRTLATLLDMLEIANIAKQRIQIEICNPQGENDGPTVSP